jgi:hypothetical protein
MERTQRGQVLPLLALVILVGGMAVVLVGRIGGAAVYRARASTAADAAALAGAAEGSTAAKGLADANGARVLGYETRGNDARVRVAVGRAEATARARRSGGGGQVPPGRQGAAPALLAALARADQVLGRSVAVTTIHGGGLEASLAAAWADRVAAVSGQVGLCRSSPADPLRFTVCP